MTLYRKIINQHSTAHRVVVLASLLWLVAVLPFLALYKGGIKPFFTPGTGFPDLAHYYMGGSIVQEGDYDSLYPRPRENTQGNLGLVKNSLPKQGYKELAETKGVEDSLRYILPPPTAFLFAPLAAIPYSIERWVWVCSLGFFIWISCALSYYIARKCGINPWAGTGWWFILAFSPLVNNAVRIANSTPILSVALGLAAIGLYLNKTALSVSMCILAGLLKGTSVIFAPLILFMKRYSVVGWGIAAVLLINVATVLIMGRGVYEEFWDVIYPSTQYIVTDQYNRSIHACLNRMFGEDAVNGSISTAIKFTYYSIGIFLLCLTWTLRAELSKNRETFNAAVLSLLGVYLIFSPYAWIHYSLCYFPFLPLLWHSLRNRILRLIMLGAYFGIWLPPGIRIAAPLAKLPEPLSSHLLLGQIIIVSLAISVLIRTLIAKKKRQKLNV